MSVQIKRSRAIGSLSVTPLIDVVFLLLIFFLVTSRFEQEERQLELNLPNVSEALPASAQPQELVVNISKQGQYFIDGQFRQLEQVEQVISRAHQNNPLTQTVIIRADKQVEWENVAIVINLCRKIGINDYSATMDEPSS